MVIIRYCASERDRRVSEREREKERERYVHRILRELKCV